jgi:hypothetical protein
VRREFNQKLPQLSLNQDSSIVYDASFDGALYSGGASLSNTSSVYQILKQNDASPAFKNLHLNKHQAKDAKKLLRS